MRRKLILLLPLAMALLFAMTASAQYSRVADVVTTDHNMSSTSTGTIHAVSNKEICFFCHVPHAELNTADPGVTTGPNKQPPLWNHVLSTTASYGVYSSPTFNALGTDITDVGGATAGSAVTANLCLSCHDGTVGVNTLYHGQFGVGSPDFGAGANMPVFMPAAVQITDLSSIHPVNFTYDATLAAKSVSLKVPISQGTLGGTQTGLPGSVANSFLPLPGNKMQCTSCHDVHSNAKGRPFLRDTTTGSALCLDCHGK